MSRNGSGSYSLPAGNPVTTGTTISSTVHNNTLSDIATALSDSLAKDGQTTPTANLPMGGYAHTGVGDATARTQYAKVSQIQDGGYVTLSSVSGTNTITATCAPAITAYAAGQFFTFVSAGANTGAVTLNINSLGAKAVTKEGTTALAAGDIASGAVVCVEYDGTRFQLVGGRTIQALDATLTALSGTLTAANKIPYATGIDTAGELDFLDEDNMASDSATAVPSQQSVKAYVDTQVATKNIATQVAPGTSGNILTSNGSAWTSAAPASSAAILQVVTATIAAATGTSTIPDDTTAPLVSEGTQVASASITPADNTNKVRLSASFSGGIYHSSAPGTGGGILIVSVFRGSTLIGSARLNVGYQQVAGPPGYQAFLPVSIELEDSPATTSATTYTIRVGIAGTDITGWYVNRTSASATALDSSMTNSRIVLEEISA